MNEELGVLKIVVSKLESLGIPYMVTGSIAANFYTTPRMTRDIDIVIEIDLKDCDKLYSLFSKDFYANIDSIREAAQKKRMFNLIHNKSIVKIDFIVRKDAEFPKVEFERRRKIDFEGLNIWIASPEDLIVSKLSWAKESQSETQIRDVRSLLKSVAGLDIGYVEKWVPKLGLDDIYREANK